MQEVQILNYAPIKFSLPKNFKTHQIYYQDYPRHKWGDGVIEYLEQINDKTVILLLEDYWLTRAVNNEGITILASLIKGNDNILRVDLTADRQYAGGMRDAGYVEWFDLIEAPNSPYQMSLQAGIWHRENLLKVLKDLPKDSRSSWDVELIGTNLVNNKYNFRVLGTRQCPLRYVNGVNDAKGVNKEMKLMSALDKKVISKWIKDK
jgi:hypothetical protein